MPRFLSVIAACSLAFFLFGCASSVPNHDKNLDKDYPEWVTSPPREDGYIFGIGSDASIDDAKRKSIVNVGQQFSTRVVSVLEDKQVARGNGLQTIVTAVNNQFTDHEVIGAKFADSFIDESGINWVLTRAPRNCVLDVGQSVLLSYSYELESTLPPVEIIDEAISAVDGLMDEALESYYVAPRKVDGIVAVQPGDIKVDGDVDDWDFPALAVDPAGDADVDRQDITAVFLAMDGEYLYVRADFREGRPSANASDMTYDLRFTLGADHIELWCLKTEMGPAVNIGIRTGTGGARWNEYPRDCRTRTTSGHLEARFPLARIDSDPDRTQPVYSVFRVRDGGQEFDRVELPVFNL